MTPDWLYRLPDTVTALPDPPERQYLDVVQHGTMHAGLYAPRGTDDQTPHRQDELYVVVTGSGMFRRAEERFPFSAGDMLFVPAGMEHRFEDFSDDFAAWAIFWGPPGGET